MHVLNRRPARHLTTGGVRWVGPVVVLLAVLGLVLAPTPASPGADAAGAVAAAGVPPRFAGTVDEFYVVPSPLPAGAPGELLRVQDVSSGGGTTTVRIMYHSVDAAGRDRAVTGIVTYPDGPAPVGGWPVVSLAPGTSGLAAPCATSRSGAPAPVFGVPAVGVRTDYIGLGPVGELQPYLSRASEAHAVVDAVRAAHQLVESGAGTRWLAVGHSQGGHAALAANELGQAYAPELQLLGTVSLAPAAMLDRTYNPVDRIVANIVGVMALYGSVSEHPEIHPTDYVSAQTDAVAQSVLPSACLDAIIPAFLTVPPDQFYVHDPAVTEPARSLLLANDVGTVAVASPLLLVQGTEDARVFVDRTRDLEARLCATGQVTEYVEYPGATHDDVVALASPRITAWLQDRLAGAVATDTCTAAPSTTTTAPSPSTAAAVATNRSGAVVPAFTG